MRTFISENQEYRRGRDAGNHWRIRTSTPESRDSFLLFYCVDGMLLEVPPEKIAVKDVGAYSLTQRFGFAGVSGFSWFLYRRSD